MPCVHGDRVLVLLFLFSLAAGCVARQAPDARPMQAIDLADGSVYSLTASAVTQTMAGKPETLYAYNGMLPGPLLKVRQGSRVSIDFRNSLPYDTTVHWHGVRVAHAFDGVPGVTQEPVKPGETFRYELSFPDEGIYWYHPHLREDRQQELGLYGAILVEPRDPVYYNPVDREEVLFLDDLLLEPGGMAGFNEDQATHALMGRYGNTLFVNWQNNYRLKAGKGQTLRFYLVNAANARPFHFTVEGHPLKLVGLDSGKPEREALVEGVVLGPSERAIVELALEKAGSFKLLNATPDASYTLGVLEVEAASAPTPATDFSSPHANPVLQSSLAPFKALLDQQPDLELELDVEMQGMDMTPHALGGAPEPIEWEEGRMAAMNSASTPENTKWILRDRKTGKENMDVRFEARAGSIQKIRIHNLATSAHPMQHPLHLHGNRFLVASVDGKPNDNLAWKDSVLVPAGSTVDLLVDFSNPGQWMLHCHIPEHLESGMMALLEVRP
ncbi:MAG: multicopper oxidase family protein [Candidatus Diapherotrites archaeon]|uniref:Multicopper oxidase family protein n=1 Tax=Candidatus Iainarchaeum sp. TaxID=3101447 RepID=A0A8T4L6I6_9ARCH|nr:multicopper oxidase family protein [Candidatus Diapherotrites archaeon]